MHQFDDLFPVTAYDPAMVPKPIDWQIDGLWQVGKINAMAGFEKSGKSRLLGWLLVALTKGEVFGLYTQPTRRILYLCGEETKEVVNDRLTKYAAIQQCHVPALDFIEASGMRLDYAAHRAGLSARLASGAYDWLVIDPLRRVHGADENDNTQMAIINNEFRRWSNSQRIGMVLLHHTPKIGEDTDMSRIAHWFRGATDTAAIVDTAQLVERISSKSVRVQSQGRFSPREPLVISDLGDERGFVRSFN